MVRTVLTLQTYKQQHRKIVAVTAWDYLLAEILDQAGVDMILVGDSLGMVALGYETTLPVTLEEMIHHAKAVRRGVKSAFLVVDLPFLSYHISPGWLDYPHARHLRQYRRCPSGGDWYPACQGLRIGYRRPTAGDTGTSTQTPETLMSPEQELLLQILAAVAWSDGRLTRQ